MAGQQLHSQPLKALVHSLSGFGPGGEGPVCLSSPPLMNKQPGKLYLKNLSLCWPEVQLNPDTLFNFNF